MKIVIVGEAFGEAEEKEGKPFVGSAGRVLDGILEEVGLPRAMCHITNVVMARPANNNFSIFYNGQHPTPELLQHRARLTEEIMSIQPNLIVCLGVEAMRAVCGDQYRSIEQWRGSIIQTPVGKAMPTIHPATILRQWLYRPAVVADFTKALTEMEFPEVKRRHRELVIGRDFNLVMAELERLKGVENVAFDIETETSQITCIGFSDRPDWAICIPFWFGASGSLWSQEEEVAIWRAIRDILEADAPKKIGQNGIYDMEFLRNTMSINVRGYDFDTMLGFHTLYPELPCGLDYLVSIYTDHPYYKYGRKSDSMDELFRYNATDAVLTFECADAIRAELIERGLENFYINNVHALIDPILGMQIRGVAFDSELREELRDEYQLELVRLQAKLETLAQRKININSPKQMKEWLYGSGGLGLVPRTKKRKETGEDTVSADEEALEALYKETGNEAIKTVIEMRGVSKILSTYLEVNLDDDKRIRCSYLIHGTETGRLSSRQTLRGTGTNLQNIPSGDIRRLFIADSGCVLINADLSQAEARVVAYLANETRLIRVFEGGGDIHRKNAANIFGCPEEEVTDEQRQLAKRVVHASNYGMGPRTFAKQIGCSEAEAKRLLNRYFATYPGIRNWHVAVADELRRKRQLTNPFGRKRVFFGRWGDSLTKEGLAFVPQSTVADIVNEAIIELDRAGYMVLLQVHDSLVVQVRTEALEEGVDRIRKALTKPIEINGRVLTIPVDVKVGKNWEDMEKWKSPVE